MKKKSITSNYIYNLIYQLLILLIPLFTTPYLTRVLGASELGIYSYTYSIVTIFFLLASLGINTYGQREIAYVQDDKKKRSKVFWELIIVRFFSTIISLLLLIAFSLITSNYSIYYQIFLVYVLANMFDITWFYQGIEDFKGVSIRNSIIKFLFLISVFVFVKTKNDLWIYILLFSLSTIITNITFWIKINKFIEVPKFKTLKIKKHFKPVIVFFIPQIASLIYTVLDKTMIGLMVPNISNVSFYEQASYIVKTIMMLITTIATVMISKMSYYYEKKDYKKLKEYLTGIVNFVWLGGCALLFGICAVINNFVPWFYGNEYLSVINLVYVLSPLIILIGLNNVIGIQYLIPTKQQNKYIFAVLIGALVNLILNLIFINIFGTIGAAISSCIAEFIILLIELRYVKNVITIIQLIKPYIKYVLYGIIMFIPTYLCGNLFGSTIYGTLFQMIIGCIIYLFLLLLTKDEFMKKKILSNIYSNRRKK